MATKERPVEETAERPELGPVPISAPMYSAAIVQHMRAANDSYLVFVQPRPATLEGKTGAIQEAVAIVHLSTATLKDLSVLIGDAVAQIEEAQGHPIETEFTRRRAKERGPKSKHA